MRKSICGIAFTAAMGASVLLTGCGKEGNSKISFDEAVELHYKAIYESDISKWEKIVPQKIWEEYPEAKSCMEELFENTDTKEFLPGGWNTFSYEEYALTSQLDSEEAKEMESTLAKYGVEKVDEAWHIEANVNGEDETIIVKSGDNYYSTYALGYILYELGEDTDGLFY